MAEQGETRHSGTDFGAGTTPVTVGLPFESVKKWTVHKITRPDGSPADPRDNNLSSRNVIILSESLPPDAFNPQFVVNDKSGALPGGLPPGAIYRYVFEW